MELTERQKGLLTLICDKINKTGYSMGAHHNRNWVTQAYYKHSPESQQMQGTIDRIGKVEYYRTYHIDESRPKEDQGLFNFGHERLGPEFFDHSLHFIWREPFGKGWGQNPPESMLEHEYTYTDKDGNTKTETMPSSLIKDKAGNWHSQCDLAFHETLWHPISQHKPDGTGQECIGGCWLKHPHPQWRPTYHYTVEEVTEALKIMCQTFDWEFEDKGESEYMIIYG